MTKKKPKQIYGLGAIVAIPLPTGRFAFAKLFKDMDFGVYNFISDKIEAVHTVTMHNIAFFQAATVSEIKSGRWPIIGEEPFPDEESAWGPPQASGILPGFQIDPLSVQLSHKGSSRFATIQEVAGLDIRTFCHRPELLVAVIVERLVEGKHEKYRVKP
jgi:hypothetical protein